MGILSKIKERSDNRDIKLKKCNTLVTSGKKETAKTDAISSVLSERKDIPIILAYYIVSLEVLLSAMIGSNKDFVSILESFRNRWNIDKTLSEVIDYDKVFDEMATEVMLWLESLKEQKTSA